MSDMKAPVGYFFVSFKEDESGIKKLHEQGQIKAWLEYGSYLVDNFEWLMGDYHSSKIVDMHFLKDWLLFLDKESMCNFVQGFNKK